jgi:hypothetical protein
MKKYNTIFLTQEIPSEIPLVFKEEFTPKDKIIHKGIFSPDLEQYYYTISDTNYTQFDVYVVKKEQGSWSTPQKAFFTSTYDDHGMSFSPNGNTLFFSSTRPTHVNGVADTWHLWKSEKNNGKWSKPSYIDIPNLRDKLVSHPVVTNSGTLYFHASNLDYSEMNIYFSKSNNGIYENAQKASISSNVNAGKCTPYVSPNEDYLLFASIGNQLDLHISFNDGNGKWINTRKLSTIINTSGQGNPYVTPDQKFLFYTTGSHETKNWKVNWVQIASELTMK